MEFFFDLKCFFSKFLANLSNFYPDYVMAQMARNWDSFFYARNEFNSSNKIGA